jgi:hypothetical protein
MNNFDKKFEDEEVLIINEDVQVIEYAPQVFAFLRNLDYIDHKIR